MTSTLLMQDDEQALPSHLSFLLAEGLTNDRQVCIFPLSHPQVMENFRSIPFATGVLFLGLQLGAIVYARFTPARYFCWAPYDEINLFPLEVNVDGKKLRPKEISARYRVGRRDNRSIQHVKNIIQQYEETYGRDEDARVILRYRTNGHNEQQQWRWPAIP